MQERNFEKQVRDKMEELSLVPSESVWRKVEEQVRKKKERRKVVLWLFIFLLLPAGFLVWQTSENRHKKDIAAYNRQPASATKDHQTDIKQPSTDLREPQTDRTEPSAGIQHQQPGTKEQPENNKERQTETSNQPSDIATQLKETKTPLAGTKKQPEVIKEQQRENSDQPLDLAKQQTETKASITTIKKQPAETKNRQSGIKDVAITLPVQRGKTAKNIETSETAKANKNPLIKKQNRKQQTGINNKGGKDLPSSSDFRVAAKKKKTVPGRELPVPDQLNKNKTGAENLENIGSLTSRLGPVELLKAEKGIVSEEITARPRLQIEPATALVIKKNKKWQWSVQASTGISGIIKDAPKPAELDVILPSSQIVSGSASLPPSRNEIGFSASGGIRLARKITARLSVTAGLQYHFYSTRVRVGHTVYNDTTMLYSSRGSFRLGNYYLNNQPVSNYQNRYHFVELPLGVEYRLLHKRPLYGHIGVNLSRLTSTNALFYHNQAGIYFTGKSLFRKSQASAFGELSYRVAKIGKASLVAGPQAQYALTGLMDKNASGKQHLFFAGWNTRVFF